MSATRKIYCCECSGEVAARLVGGDKIYPHRSDLHFKKFWLCDKCQNYVGTHYSTSHKGGEAWRPLGVIPTKEMRTARQHIHQVIDPLWQRGAMSRSQVYNRMTELMGWRFHTASLKSIEEARRAYFAARSIAREIMDALKAKTGKQYTRIKLSPQLSRLRKDGFLELNGREWFWAQSDKT